MPHSCHPALGEQSSSAAESWTSKFFTACVLTQPLVTSNLSTTLPLVRQYEMTKWWWKKVVQIVQTSIRFFRSAFAINAVATSAIVEIKCWWRVSAPVKHIFTGTTSCLCILFLLCPVTTSLFKRELEPPIVALTILSLLCTASTAQLKKNRYKVVASEGLCNDPHALVQSMQILNQSCPIMYQQLSLDATQCL